jgi:hypothetical protein
MSIKVGMIATLLHRLRRSYLEILREDREVVILGDPRDYSGFFVGQHHTSLLE